ncbi:hypothetical protein E4U03_11575 [Rothia nasimurium]|uniref:GAP family protein n=2 Tax=Rothia nasimurium TaxID=85336 RepID=A0A4Y9F0G2_9MICC|nr:hypothetical protein [Rothia nasimurium]TFU20353.1 hypothetical protein E4U03_11575 [Rothia nasimurium]
MMGFSPSLYSITFLALIDDPSKMHIVRWISGGIVIGASTLVMLFRFVDPESLIQLVHSDTSKILVRKSIDAGAALLLALSAVLLWVRRNRPKRVHKVKNSHLSPRKAVLEGFLNSAIGLSSMATMYMVGRLLTSVSHNSVEWVLAYLIFTVGIVGPYLLLEASWDRFPSFAHTVTGLLARTKNANLTAVYSLILLVGAVFFGVLAAR